MRRMLLCVALGMALGLWGTLTVQHVLSAFDAYVQNIVDKRLADIISMTVHTQSAGTDGTLGTPGTPRSYMMQPEGGDPYRVNNWGGIEDVQ